MGKKKADDPGSSDLHVDRPMGNVSVGPLKAKLAKKVAKAIRAGDYKRAAELVGDARDEYKGGPKGSNSSGASSDGGGSQKKGEKITKDKPSGDLQDESEDMSDEANHPADAQDVTPKGDIKDKTPDGDQDLDDAQAVAKLPVSKRAKLAKADTGANNTSVENSEGDPDDDGDEDQPGDEDADPDDDKKAAEGGRGERLERGKREKEVADYQGRKSSKSPGSNEDDGEDDDGEDYSEAVPMPSKDDDAPTFNSKMTYLSKLHDHMKASMTPEDYSAAMRAARGHTGGKAKAAKKVARELFSEGSMLSTVDGPRRKAEGMRLFVKFAESEGGTPPEWIPFLPRPGVYSHPEYDKVAITRQRLEKFVEQFNEGVYQTQVPLDLEHETKLSGAAAWIKELRMCGDGHVEARVEWTDRGRKAYTEDRFRYISPEWYDDWDDPISGKRYSDVVIGGALTVRPFFKEKVLPALVASEGGLRILDKDVDLKLKSSNKYAEPKGWAKKFVGNMGALVQYQREHAKQDDSSSSSDSDEEYAEADLTQDQRDAWAKQGLAKPDGSFPIPNVEYLKKAIKSYGRGGASDGDKEWIVKRAKALGATKFLPEEWGGAPEGAKDAEFNESNKEPKVKVKEAGSQTVDAARFAEVEEKNRKLTERQKELEKDNRKMSEQVKDLRRVARVAKFTELSKDWFGDREAHVNMLETLAVAFGEDEGSPYATYVKQNEESTEKVRASGVFKEYGTTRSTGKARVSATEDVTERSNKMVAAGEVKTKAEAMNKIFAEDPELLQRYRRETYVRTPEADE